MDLADVVIPTSTAARAADEVLREHAPPALVNHCHRSYLFAAALGAATGVDHDAEVLFVASMLHDLGLEPPFDSVSEPFEEAGGAVARVFLAGAGWPPDRRARVSRAIVAHMRDEVVQEQDPEGHLLAMATSLDISGRGVDLLEEFLLREIVGEYPRLDLVSLFTDRFADQARRKPASAAAQSMAAGLATRLAGNPLERYAAR